MDAINNERTFLDIGEQIFNQLVHPHLETARAKLETDEGLTKEEKAAVAIASGARITECKLDGDTLTITTEPIGVEKTAIGFHVFQHKGTQSV